MKSLLPAVIEHHTFLPWLFGKQPVVIDFGLNQGHFAMTVIDRYDARVFGAEPSSELFSKLPSHANLRARNVAIGGNDGVASLQLYSQRCFSLYSGANDLANGAETVNVWSLRTFLLDFQIEVVDLMKVDIEGAECDLFEVASDADLLRCRQISVEFHDFMIALLGPRVESIKARLERLGFRRINFSLNNGDVLFVRDDSISFVTNFLLRWPYKYALGAARVTRRALSRD